MVFTAKKVIDMDLVLIAPLIAIVAMVTAGILFWWVNKQSPGTKRMEEIASYIQEGANAFLKRQMQSITYFIAAIAVILLICMPHWQIAFAFVVGALMSQLAIFIGMGASVRANVRTANAARTSPTKALTIAFRGGSVMGLTIVAFNLLGISLLLIFFGATADNPEPISWLVGFGFGASLAALFAQLGGGIFTKAADVGADLVGKIEEGIPEDDPRNPAVIADLVGDNVGDCAGRGADLFESGSDNLVCTMIVALSFIFWEEYGWAGVLFPLLTRSIGSIGTIIGMLAVRGWKGISPINSVNIGLISTGIFSLITFYFLATWIMHDINLFYCLSLGLFAAFAVSLIVQYYTGTNRKPVKSIAEASEKGAAINIMTGFSYGLESVMLPLALLGSVIVASYYICGGGIFGIYGILAATLGITEMKGIIMASDAFGPICDNASGISEMSGLSSEVRESADVLDAAGNITKAVTKGFAMSCCLLTGVVILFAYLFEIGRHTGMPINSISDIPIFLADPLIIVALMIGATVPFLFSALAIRAVGKTSSKIVEEARRQFREIPGLSEGKAKADYSRCVDIATKNSLRQMVAPTLVGLLPPIIVGFTLGVWALAAYLIACKIVGAILAIFMFNSGGAWDNAKKYIEAGHLGGKGTSTHAASVVGDTFGDPLKDTAGPSLHILIKLSNITAITLLPLFLAFALISANVAPTIISVFPGDLQTDVPMSTNIVVTFDKEMNQTATEEAFNLETNGISVSGSFIWSAGNTTVIYYPVVDLDEGTVYWVNITIEATDLLGNSLSTPWSSSFTTEVTPP
jgi:K(+)-stimulated pyrophosphate-energized sodium pump